MPYTPPSHHSPASSLSVTPALSRTGSYIAGTSPPRSPGPRLSLPRSVSSTAYLTKSRRSPVAQTNGISNEQSFHTNSSISEKNGSSISNSLRQSPPPVNDDAIPTGAVMSPPESPRISSDDEESDKRTYQTGEIRELERAVRRSLTPNGVNPHGELSPTDVEKIEKKVRNLKLQMPEKELVKEIVEETLQLRPRLGPNARKISHSRANTESAIFDQRSQFSTSPNSDEESDSDGLTLSRKPPLLRKKSGELVKPAIRPPSRRKHSSAPGTPTYSKAVHFNEEIEQVRHFLQVDRPIAVSAGGSPADGYEDEAEFPFNYPDNTPAVGSELEIRLGHFSEGDDRKWCPVRVEKISLSPDQKSLLGVVAVANWGYQKLVIARFTFDYWKTTSEVVAEYSNEVRQTPREDSHDQFNFNIRLSDQANIESKTLLICVKYNVNGQDHWDNNSGMNFQIDFSRKQKPEPVVAPVSPRPPRSRHNSSSSSKPRAAVTIDDEFPGLDAAPAIRFRSGPSVTRSLSDSPVRRQTPAGQAFGSRYDFGASLTAALSHAQATLGDRSGIKAVPQTPAMARTNFGVPGVNGTDSPRADALLANKHAVDSRAYQEFVSKFCFYGSAPEKKNTNASSTISTSVPHNVDGAQDDNSKQGGSPNSLSPPKNEESLGASHYEHSPRGASPVGSRSSSPSISETASSLASPMMYGYPYQDARNGFFAPEQHTATA